MSTKKIEWVSVDLRNYKHYFLDILDINIGFADRTETRLDDPKNHQFVTFLTDLGTMDEENPDYEILKAEERKLQKVVAKIIKDAGYGDVELTQIEYDIVEVDDEED